MIALKIEDIGLLTSGLFVKDMFDSFLIREAHIVTFNTFSIDGHVKKGYYSREEAEEQELGELSQWKLVKPFCFSVIKGKRLPISFQVVLQLSPHDTEVFIEKTGVSLKAEQVKGLYLNIRYENSQLYCITGTSLNTFTMDQTLEREWDQAAASFLKKHGIAVDY